MPGHSIQQQNLKGFIPRRWRCRQSGKPEAHRFRAEARRPDRRAPRSGGGGAGGGVRGLAAPSSPDSASAWAVSSDLGASESSFDSEASEDEASCDSLALAPVSSPLVVVVVIAAGVGVDIVARLHLGLRGAQDAEIMFGMLQVVLGHDRVARSLRVARQLHVALGDVSGVAADLHVRAVALEIARQGIDVLASVIASTRTVLVLLVRSHNLCSALIAQNIGTPRLPEGVSSPWHMKRSGIPEAMRRVSVVTSILAKPGGRSGSARCPSRNRMVASLVLQVEKRSTRTFSKGPSGFS